MTHLPDVIEKMARYRPRVLCLLGAGLAKAYNESLHASTQEADPTYQFSRAPAMAGRGWLPWKIVHPAEMGRPQQTYIFVVSRGRLELVRLFI